MKQKLLLTAAMSAVSLVTFAQQGRFTEYDLDNRLHVILHQDKSAPVVAVSVMYHVGSKDETPARKLVGKTADFIDLTPMLLH